MTLSLCKDLSMTLAKFPRVRLGHFPTPLEPMDRLSEQLGGPRLWVKRDDCTGLSSGGNKTRKLEYLMADRAGRGCRYDHHPRGNPIKPRAPNDSSGGETGHGMPYLAGGPHRIQRPQLYPERQRVAGPSARRVCVETRQRHDMNDEMETLAEKLRTDGKKPYIIPGGGSNPIGALGYVNCARELVEQAAAMGLHIDAMVHATGSSGTQAGLVAGLAAIQSDIHLLGIGVRAPQEKQEQMVFDLAQKTADHMGIGLKIARSDVRANTDYVGPGYGLPTDGMIEAVKLLAQTEGLLFDPVYSGKGLDGLIDQIGKGYFDGMDDVVFLHTGGSAALFGYADTFGLPGYTD